MFASNDDSGGGRFGFILMPEFSMIAFASAVEPLRLTNRVCDAPVFGCLSYSMDGEAVIASNGMPVIVDGAIEDAEGLDAVFVCAGVDVHRYASKPLMARLRRLAQHGTAVGGICTGTLVLARAGLLEDHRCTIHWGNVDGLIEEFPHLDVTQELFELDRKRWTCSGGTAPLDMMLNLIAQRVSPPVAASIADELIYHRIREPGERQRMELRSRIGVAHTKLLEVVETMEGALEEPLSCTDLARDVGLSTRQLERLFRKYMGMTPTRYYLELRLKRARFLLQQTSLPILSVGLACGFVSASHFSKCYREHFQRTPSDERRPGGPGVVKVKALFDVADAVGKRPA